MRVIGVDPGLGITGYGVVEQFNAKLSLVESGAIKPPPREKTAKRICIIYTALKKVLEKTKPDVLVLEKLYSHYKHPVTAILMGHVRGAVCLLAALKNIPVIGYSATRVKKAITGRGNASKAQVQGMLQNLLNIDVSDEPFDVSDAVALAVTHTHMVTNQKSEIRIQELEKKDKRRNCRGRSRPSRGQNIYSTHIKG